MNNYVSGNNGLAFSMPRVCGMKSFRIKMLLFHVFVPIFMALMITNEQNFASMILLSCHSFFMPANPRHRINLFSPLNVLLVIWIPEQIAMGQCCKSMRLCYRSHSWKSKQFSLFHCFVFNILLRSVIFPTNIRSCVCVCVWFPLKRTRCAYVHGIIKCSSKLIACTKCQIDTMGYKKVSFPLFIFYISNMSNSMHYVYLTIKMLIALYIAAKRFTLSRKFNRNSTQLMSLFMGKTGSLLNDIKMRKINSELKLPSALN